MAECAKCGCKTFTLEGKGVVVCKQCGQRVEAVKKEESDNVK